MLAKKIILIVQTVHMLHIYNSINRCQQEPAVCVFAMLVMTELYMIMNLEQHTTLLLLLLQYLSIAEVVR